MPNPDLASERRAFEAHWKTHIDYIESDLIRTRALSGVVSYKDAGVQNYWMGWLARSAIPEITEAMTIRLAEHQNPGLFSDDPDIAHRAASPRQVYYARIDAYGKAKDCLTAALSIPHSTVKDIG